MLFAVCLLALCGTRTFAQDPQSVSATSMFGPFYVPGAWVPVRVDVVNNSDQPVDGYVLIPLRGEDGSEADGAAKIRRDVYVPARARVTMSMFVYLTEGSSGVSNRAQTSTAPEVVVATLHDNTGRRLDRTPMLGKPVSQMSGDDFQGNVIFILPVGDLPFESTSDAYEAQDLKVTLGETIGASVMVRPPLGAAELPPYPTTFDGTHTLVMQGNPADLTTAQRNSIMDWVRTGGVLVVPCPLDQTDPTGTWLAPYLPVQLIGRRLAWDILPGEDARRWGVKSTSRSNFTSSDFTSQDEDEEEDTENAQDQNTTQNPARAKVNKPVAPRDPTDVIALTGTLPIVEAVEPNDTEGVVVLARDASFVHVAYRNVGMGRVVFTSFPVGALSPTDARTGLLWREALGLTDGVSDRSLASTGLGARRADVLSSMVGLTVPPWSVAAAVGGGYLLLVVGAQLILGGAKRPRAFAVTVGAGVVVAVGLLVLAKVRQSGQPLTAASLSVIDVAPEGGGLRQDALVVFGQNVSQLSLAPAPGMDVVSLRSEASTSGEVPTVYPIPPKAVMDGGAVSAESIGRVWTSTGTAPAGLSVRATGTFGPQGLDLILDNATGETLASPLLVWAGSTFALNPIPSGKSAQGATPDNLNARGSFSGRAVFTSEQEKLRGDVVRWMTTSASPEKLLQVNPPAPVLTAWVSAGVAPPSIVTDPPVSSTKSEVVLRLPVDIQPSPAGSTVRIDGAFNTLINGPAPLSIYDFGRRQWLSTNQPGDWTVGFQPPAQIGRVRPGRVTVSMDASAPLHVVSLKRGQVRAGKVVDNPAGEELGRWVKPVTPQTLSFEVGDQDVDEQGRVWLKLGVEPAGDGMSVSQWRMLDLRVSFDEAVVE